MFPIPVCRALHDDIDESRGFGISCIVAAAEIARRSTNGLPESGFTEATAYAT